MEQRIKQFSTTTLSGNVSADKVCENVNEIIGIARSLWNDEGMANLCLNELMAYADLITQIDGGMENCDFRLAYINILIEIAGTKSDDRSIVMTSISLIFEVANDINTSREAQMDCIYGLVRIASNNKDNNEVVEECNSKIVIITKRHIDEIVNASNKDQRAYIRELVQIASNNNNQDIADYCISRITAIVESQNISEKSFMEISTIVENLNSCTSAFITIAQAWRRNTTTVESCVTAINAIAAILLNYNKENIEYLPTLIINATKVTATQPVSGNIIIVDGIKKCASAIIEIAKIILYDHYAVNWYATKITTEIGNINGYINELIQKITGNLDNQPLINLYNLRLKSTLNYVRMCAYMRMPSISKSTDDINSEILNTFQCIEKYINKLMEKTQKNLNNRFQANWYASKITNEIENIHKLNSNFKISVSTRIELNYYNVYLAECYIPEISAIVDNLNIYTSELIIIHSQNLQNPHYELLAGQCVGKITTALKNIEVYVNELKEGIEKNPMEFDRLKNHVVDLYLIKNYASNVNTAIKNINKYTSEFISTTIDPTSQLGVDEINIEIGKINTNINRLLEIDPLMLGKTNVVDDLKIYTDEFTSKITTNLNKELNVFQNVIKISIEIGKINSYANEFIGKINSDNQLQPELHTTEITNAVDNINKNINRPGA